MSPQPPRTAGSFNKKVCVGVWGAHLEAHSIELRPTGKAKIVHLPAFQGKVGFLKSTFISFNCSSQVEAVCGYFGQGNAFLLKIFPVECHDLSGA